MVWGGGSTSQQQAVLPMLQDMPQQAVLAGWNRKMGILKCV